MLLLVVAVVVHLARELTAYNANATLERVAEAPSRSVVQDQQSIGKECEIKTFAPWRGFTSDGSSRVRNNA